MGLFSVVNIDYIFAVPVGFVVVVVDDVVIVSCLVLSSSPNH